MPTSTSRRSWGGAGDDTLELARAGYPMIATVDEAGGIEAFVGLGLPPEDKISPDVQPALQDAEQTDCRGSRGNGANPV